MEVAFQPDVDQERGVKGRIANMPKIGTFEMFQAQYANALSM